MQLSVWKHYIQLTLHKCKMSLIVFLKVHLSVLLFLKVKEVDADLMHEGFLLALNGWCFGIM